MIEGTLTRRTNPLDRRRIRRLVATTVVGLLGPIVAQPAPATAVDPPLTTTQPRIEGYIAVGATATAVVEPWGPAPVTLTYQWLRNGTPIPGAQSVTYDMVEADALTDVSVAVTGEKPGYATTTLTSEIHRVVRVFTAVSVPTVSGEPDLGSTLTAVPGTWQPAPIDFAFAWFRDAAPIADATASTYQVVAADIGRSLTVRVTGSKTDYGTEFRTSAPVVVHRLLGPAPVPTIVGGTDVGKTVSVAPGVWGPAPVSLTVQWTRNGVDIPGATALTYLVAASDKAALLRVRVTGRKPGYTTASVVSEGRRVNLSMIARIPKVTGNPKVGWTLVARPGLWRPVDATFTFQWYRNGKAIVGARGRTYRTSPVDRGATIIVRVTARKPGYTTTGRNSTALTIR